MTDALRPGLNTARRQHLDSLVPAWNPANPRELVLLGSTSYTIRFANMAMLREINDHLFAGISYGEIAMVRRFLAGIIAHGPAALRVAGAHMPSSESWHRE